MRVFPTPEVKFIIFTIMVGYKMQINQAFDRWTSLRWNSDIRLYNVLQMLDSSLPVLIPVSHKPTVSLLHSNFCWFRLLDYLDWCPTEGAARKVCVVQIPKTSIKWQRSQLLLLLIFHTLFFKSQKNTSRSTLSKILSYIIAAFLVFCFWPRQRQSQGLLDKPY